MKKILLLVLILPLCFACSKDNSDNTEVDTSEYYVSYNVKSSSMYIGKIDVIYSDENNRKIAVQTSRTGNWEVVVGPVKKGFNASLAASDPRPDLYHLKLSVKISVSKNDSQFADKAIDSSSDDRSSASIRYTINY